MNTKTTYKVTVAFQGTAVIEMEAETPEAARLAAAELTPADLARQGHADVRVFKIAAREITPAASLSGQEEEGSENAPRKPRPSGWYRPL